MRAAVLGLGEAGRRYATDLAAAGVTVSGYDTRDVEPPPGVAVATDVAEAVRGADLVLSLTTAAGALDAVHAAAAHLGPDTVYADLNTAAPGRKEAAARALHNGRFADVAVLAPVPRDGVRTPVLVSGPGAEAYARLMDRFGGRIEVVPGGPGAASGRKLLRSIFMKCLATTVLEALAAGRAARCRTGSAIRSSTSWTRPARPWWSGWSPARTSTPSGAGTRWRMSSPIWTNSARPRR